MAERKRELEDQCKADMEAWKKRQKLRDSEAPPAAEAPPATPGPEGFVTPVHLPEAPTPGAPKESPGGIGMSQVEEID